ncbi:hypothetical protein PISMIDRAFT_18310 [Pisolithus microcarpus 441]|uniref:Uncharacterized protein n=1 Tax=Pisolithus microcarpus 441 TaxID=765257 RepID=A0A0C9YRU3_9AGAM|nr:hypothetical protein PISMIDRAFT_18310 [Pisolithus microcarpus 441]
MDSPVRALHTNVASTTSLRPYSKTPTVSQVQIGQHIMAWATLNASISPLKLLQQPLGPQPKEDIPAIWMMHMSTLTPAPTANPSPIFKALQPAVSKVPRATATIQ